MSTTIYVNSTWKSGEKVTIDGVEYTVGTDAFTSYNGALNYAKNNSTARNATIVMMKNSSVSGNCIDQDTHKGYYNLKVTIQDGAVMGNANSKWDMTYAFTVEAGGVLQSARPASAGYGYTHVKNVMTIGEADAEKQAVVDFINSPTIPYKTMCISVLYNGTLNVTNAIFKVGDLGMIGKSEFTDSTIEVAGSIGFAAGTQTCAGKHSMTNSTMTVKGHDLRNDSTYSAADCNRIANLIMDNSTIIIDDGVENTAADVVELGVLKSGFLNSKKELIMQNNSKITVEAGTQINLLYNVSMSDSVIEGGNFSIVSGDLTMTGKSNLDIAVLDIAAEKKIVIDNTASIVADALTGTGTIEINVVDAVAGLDKVIDLADGADTTGLIDRITVKQDGYSALIKDGDVYVAAYLYVESGVVSDITAALSSAEGRVVQISGRYVDVDQATMDAIANGNVKFAAGTMLFLAEGVTTAYTDANLTLKEFGVKTDLVDGVVDLAADNAIVAEDIESDANIELTTGTAVEGDAEVRADVTGKDVTLSNSKNLAVTGSVSGSNVEINNADDAVLDGGSDDYSAKISADEKITFVNDGHAVVDMSAKTIEIENNSVNTITGSKLEAETVIIDAKENADGVVSKTEIIATNVEIADQTVSDSKITGRVQITADTDLIDTEATGVVSVGFDKENAADTTLTLGGETTIDTLYVGKEGRENNYKVEVAGEDADVTLNNLYSRTDSEFVVSDKAEVNIGYWQSKGNVVVDNATVNHNGWNMYVYNNDSTSVSKITLKNGAVLNSNNSVGIVLGNKNDSPAAAIGNAELVLEGKSTLNVTNLTLQAEGEVEEVAGEKAATSMTINDSEVNVATTLTNNSVINIVMGAEDLSDGVDDVNINAKSIKGSGTIIIDATKFAGGVDKVINVSEAGDVTVVFKEGTAAEGVKMLVNEEGDVFVSDVKAETLYVDANFKGEFGDMVGEGMYLGINAFVDMDSAVNALENNETTIVLSSDAAMTADPAFKLNIISGDGKDHTLKIDSVIDVDAEFAKEINIDSALFMAYYNNHKVVVNGDLKGGFYNYTGSMTFNNSKITDSYDNSNIGGVVTINGDGNWTLENAQADNLKYLNIGRSDWLGQGILNLNDTVVKAIGLNVDSNSADKKSQINAVNSTIATVLNDGIHGYLTVGANGEVNLTDSNLIVGGAFTNNGTISINGGIVDVATVTNNGSVSITGETQLLLDNLTGSGDFDLLDGAIIKDSTVVGDASVVGKVTFRGDNTFNNIYDFGTYYANYYNGQVADWTIEAGASLTLTHKIGNAYGLGYGDKVTINGELVNAREVDRATLAREDASFYAEKGVRLSTSAGNDAADGSFFTVNNAYVVVGASGTFSNSKTSGKFTVAFNNSVVDVSQMYFSDSNDVINLSITNSDVLTAIFMTGDKDSVYTLNNTRVVTTGSGNDRYNGNDGDLTIENGSELIVEKGGYSNSGNLTIDSATVDFNSLANTGKVVVKGESTLNIDELTGNAIDLAGTLVDSTIGGGVTGSAEAGFAGENKVDSALFYEGADITVKEGADVDVANTLATWDGASLKVEKDAEIDAQSIYFNGGSIEVNGKLSAKNTNDGGFILNGADDTVTINKGGVVDVNYVDIYKTSGNSTVELYGNAKTSFKLSDGSGKFTWNIYDGGSLTAEKYGIVMNNAESAINIYGDVTAAQVSNAGSITVDGGNLNVAGTFTNNGTVNVSGESTLNIDKYNNGGFVWGKAIQLLDGAIIKDSNVGGYVDAVGKVTFRGDNTFGTIQDFEASYIDNNEAVNNTEMIIEKGASVTTESAKFNLGFGDKLSVYGNLEDAKAAYEAGTLTADDYSLDAQKGMLFQGNRADDVTTFNVNDAYVRLGANEQSVANAKDEYKDQRVGTYNFNWTNAVVEAEETFDFKESGEYNGNYNFNLDNTVLKVGAVETDNSYADAENNPAYRGAINFADKDSTFKAKDSNVVVIGKESNNYNAGTFEFDNSELNLNAALVNDGSATFDGENAELNATNVINRGTITLANGAELNAGSYSTVSAKVAFYDGSDEPENITFVAYDEAGNEIGRTTAFINGIAKDKIEDAVEVAVVKGASYKAFKADGTQINDATFEIVADSSDANLVLDETVSVKVDTFYHGGTITINVSDSFSGTKTIVDVVDGATYGEITLVGGEDVITTKNEEGDLVLYKVDTNTLFVNSEWANVADQTEIATNLVKGVNAFATAKDAIAKANEKGEAIINFGDEEYVYAGTLTSDDHMAVINKAGSYTLTGGNGYLFNYELEVNPDKEAGEYVFNIDNAYLTMAKLTLRDNVTATISDSRLDHHYFNGSGYLSVYRDSDLTITDSVIGFNKEATKVANPEDFDDKGDSRNRHWGFTFTVYGNATVTNSDMYFYVGQGVQAGFDVLGDGNVSLKDSNVDMAVLQIGTGYEDKKLSAAAREALENGEVVTATVTLDGGTLENNQYRGDSVTRTGIILGTADGKTAGKLVIKNNAVVDVTNQAGDNRYAGVEINNENSSIELIDSTLKATSVTNNGTVSIENSTLSANSVINDGSINVSGASDINTTVSGKGWIYMNNASLDADTNIQGANVRFTNGTSTLDGATIQGNAFQVGVGGYQLKDERENVADVVVNVTNGSFIGGPDVDYSGWVGTGWFEDDASKAAAMTDARYTLNIDKSNANFGYLHVSNDGILNVTGNAEEMQKYIGVDHSFYTGRFIVNGVATFDGVNTLVQFTNVSPDNGSTIPGKLVIKNGANYVSYLDSTSLLETVQISKNGIIEVDNATLDARHTTLIGEDGTLSVNNGNFLGNAVTNNGTFNVSGESHLDIDSVSGNSIRLNGSLTDSTLGSGNVLVVGDSAIKGEESTINGMVKGTNGSTLTVESGAKLVVKQLAFGDDNYPSLNIGSVEDAAKGGNMVIKGTVIGMDGEADEENSGLSLNVDANAVVTVENGGKLYTSQIAVENGNVELGETDKAGVLNIKEGGYVFARFFKAFNGGVINVDGTVRLTHSDPRQACLRAMEGGVINVGTTGSIVVDSHRAIVYSGGVLNVNGGNVTVSQADTTKGDAFLVEADGVLNLTNNATINVSGILTNNGTITLDEKSSIVLDGAFATTDGIISINVTDGWVGSKVLIDAEEGTESFGNVVVDEADAANGVMTYVDKATGDLIVYNVAKDVIYVNSAWADKGYTFGAVVEDGKVYGINAFDNLENFTVNADVATLNIAGGTYTPTAGNWVELLKDGVTAVTTDGLVVAEKGNLYFSKSEAGTYTISGSYQTTGTEGYLWENGQNLGWKTNGVIRFQGADGVVFNITDANITSSAAIQFIGGKSVIAADSVVSSDAQKESKMAVYGDVVNYGKIELVTTGNPGTALLIGHNSYASNANKLTVSGENASVMIDTGATVDANIHSTGTLIVENNAEFTATGSVVNDGKVTVDSADFNAGKLTNNGTFTATNDVNLNIGDLEGRITLENATIKDGSVIGNAEAPAGCVDIIGEEINFDGKVVVNSAVNANIADKDGNSINTAININEGADVTFNTKQFDDGTYSGGFNTNAGDKVNVAGKLTITGANVYLKAETLVAENGEFIVDDAGFQNTYGKLTVKGDMTIIDTYEDGAYQNIKLAGNDNPNTTGELDVDGGTLTIDGPSFAFGGGYKSNGWVDVKESSVLVQNGGKITANSIIFRNGVSNTLTLNNGTFEMTEAPDFTNGGANTVNETLGLTVDNKGVINASNASTVDFGDRELINDGSISIDSSDFSAGSVVNNSDITLKGDASLSAEDFDNNATLTLDGFNGTLTGVTKLDDEAVTGNIEVYGKTVIKDSFDTALLSVGAKLAERKLGSDSLTIADGVTANMANLYVKASSSMDIAAGAEVNVIGFYNKTDSFGGDGLFASYGTTNVDGTLNVSNNSGCGDNKIGYTSYANENGVAVVNVNKGGVFNLTTVGGEGAENSLVIDTDGTLNVNDGGTFNADDRATVVNNGNFNVNGEATLNAVVSGNAVNVAKDANLVDSDITADLKLAGNITLTDSSLDGKVSGKKDITLDGVNTVKFAEGSEVANLIVDGAVADTITADSVIGNVAIKGVNNAELTVGDDDIINGNKFTAVKLNLNDVELTANTVKIDIDLANIASINGVKVNNVGGAYVVLTADGKSYEMTKDEDNYISFTELAAGGDSSDEKAVIHVPTHAITGTEDASDYIFEMAEGTQSVDIKKDAELKVAGIAKNENGGITNITLAQNAKLTVGDGEGAIDSLGKFTTSSKAEFTAGDVTATNMNTVLNIGADNKGSMDVVDLKGGNNSVTVGARSTVDMESLSGVTSLKMTAGTFTKGNANKGTVDKTEYTDLTVGGDITVAAMNSTIALGNYNKLTVSGSLVNDDTNVGTAITAGNDAHINFTGDVNGASKITIGTASSLIAQDITGLVGNNTLNFGKDSVVTAKSINMKGGLDTLTIGVNAQLNVAEDIKGIYRITSSKDAKITVDNIINKVQANTYNFGADNEVTVNGGITMNNALRNNIIVGNRADMTVAKDIDGVASLSLYAGTFTKGNANKGTVDKTEYTTLTVGGDIITAAVNSTISLSNYGKLTVAGDVYASNSKFGITVKGGTDANIDVTGAMSNITSINLGADSSLKAAAINGTAANNALTFGKGANVEVKGDINLGEGKDSINLGADATLNVANINGVYMITTGKGAKFTAVDLVNTDAANNYNFGANNIVSLNDVTMNDTFKNTLKVGADSEFTANNIVGAYSVNVGKNAKFTVAEISGTEFADIYTIGQDAEVKVTASIELGAGNDSLKLGVGSDMEVTNGISFGDGNDTLTFSKDAELKVYGGVVAGLETVSGTASNTIYLYNGASIENMDSIKGIDKINVIEVIDFVNATAADSWDTESLSNGNNMDTFNLSGNEEFKVESLKNISVSYLKDDVWYDLTDASMTIAGATMVNVSLDKDYKGELEYNYSITIA